MSKIISGGAQGGITSSGSGGISSQSVVTGSRAVGTVYHNTSPTARFVCATVLSTLNSLFTVLTDSSSTPATQVTAESQLAGQGFQISFWVLPGNFYQITSGAGVASVFIWTEWN